MTVRLKFLRMFGLVFIVQTFVLVWIAQRDAYVIAPGFTPAGFAKIQVGMTRAEVETILGLPLYLTDARDAHIWLKANDLVIGASMMFYSAEVDVPVARYPVALIQLDETGVVRRVAIKQQVMLARDDGLIYELEGKGKPARGSTNSKLFPKH